MHTDSFKKAARAKADEILRKDTTDFSEDDDLVIKTREQNITKKRKIVSTDFNNLAQKCLQIKQEKYRSYPSSMESGKAGASSPKPLPKDFAYDTSSQKRLSKHLAVETSSQATFSNDLSNNFINIGDVVENESYTTASDKLIYQYEDYEQQNLPPTNYHNDQTQASTYSQDQHVVNTKSSPVRESTFPQSDENQFLTINCSNCISVMKVIEDVRKTQLVNNKTIDEIRSVVATFKRAEEEMMKELRSIRGITNAILANFDPNETPELGIIPGFTLPLNTPESLKLFESKLELDASFRLLVVNMCFFIT